LALKTGTSKFASTAHQTYRVIVTFSTGVLPGGQPTGVTPVASISR